MSQATAINETNLTQMADILLSPPSEPVMSTWLILTGLIILILIFLLLWRYFTQPLTQLQRHLLKGQLTPREAAHHLARIAKVPIELQQQINRLRFQRQRPERSELFNLIKQVKHGR